MAIYEDVQNYTSEHYGWVAQRCWIAHVKRDLGIPMRTKRSPDASRAKPCPEKKWQKVEDAMRAVGLI